MVWDFFRENYQTLYNLFVFPSPTTFQNKVNNIPLLNLKNDRFGSGHLDIEELIDAATWRFSSQVKSDEVNAFFKGNISSLSVFWYLTAYAEHYIASGSVAIERALLTIRTNMEWLASNLHPIEIFLSGQINV